MPDLARLYIKTSLAYLGAALLTGLIMALEGVGAGPAGVALWQSYIHLFVVGWLTQLIFGVAYWLFPRYSKERPFGRSALAVAAFVLLNVGLLMRVAAEPGWAWARGEIWAWALVAGASLQWGGVMAYAVYIWSRVRTK